MRLSDRRHAPVEPASGISPTNLVEIGQFPHESGGGPPALGTNTDKCATLPQGGKSTDDRRSDRYRLRAGYAFRLWEAGVLGHRLTFCGRYPGVGHLHPGASDGENAGFMGMAVCGRSYCPVCAASIQAARGQRISEAIEKALNDGRGVVFVTLTVPHVAADSLSESLDWLFPSFRAVVRGSTRDLRRAKKDLGWLGYIRTLECTYGTHGFHPHFHIAVITERPDVAPNVVDRFREALLGAWQHEVVKNGGKKPSTKHGVDVRPWQGDPATMGKYLAKAVGQELTGAEFKTRTKNGNLTMWDVMARAAEGDRRYMRTYEEFIEATSGRRFISSSKGLLRPMNEKDEEAVAVAEAQSRAPSFLLDATDWAAADHRDLAPTTLVLLKYGDAAQAREYLHAQGVTTYGLGEAKYLTEAEPLPRAANGRFAPHWVTPFEAAIQQRE